MHMMQADLLVWQRQGAGIVSRPDRSRHGNRKSQRRIGERTMSEEASKFRLLHTMIRVMDLDKSLDFYTRHLGMEVLRRKDFPDGKFTLAFLGYGDEQSNTVIELTHNWDQAEPYDHGSAFGHLAVAVPDVYATCEKAGIRRRQHPAPAGGR